MPLLYIASAISADKLRVRYRRVQERIAEVNNVLQENITGVRVAKAFAREGEQRRRFHSENRGTLDANMSTAGGAGRGHAAVQMIAAVRDWPWSSASGAGTSSHGPLTVGTLVAFVTYLIQFYQPVEDLFRVNNTIQQALSAAERIFEFIDEQPDVPSARRGRPGRRWRGCAGRSPSRTSPSPTSRGRRSCTTSPSPPRRGRSSPWWGTPGRARPRLVNLIPRFYDPDGGRVTVDGHDLRDLTPALHPAPHRRS